MKPVSLRPTSFLLAPLFFAPLALTACGGAGSPSSLTPPAYTLSVTPQPASIPVNGTVTFTATTNAPASNVSWVLVNEGNGINLGSPTTGSGLTFTYTAPPTPPLSQLLEMPPGTVTVRALAVGLTTVEVKVAVTTPEVSTALSSTTNTVALGKTLNIYAYAIGSANNAIAMQVNGTTGGSASAGTIAPLPNAFYGQYQYTAPATMPMTGNTVTITVISQADPTKTSSLTVTLTPS